ncbi:hypothetical protein ED733_007880 [Metarhizium rileyi]|uniref:F-box domain-containing protein n=1 Tax=Metarhizium rileyi (strain RCEF 4871) TaxID=1649241 RepID=A0A5C6GJV8_METRR|nr:hypothetical protein ED733_007880 [Metarhizium rileyi]
MSKTASALIPSPQCRLLSLPLELRLQIYTLLLLLPPYSKHSIHPTSVHAAILRTSRQVHAEASPLLYTQNVFLAHPSLLTSFPRLRENYPPVKEDLAIARIRRFRLLIRLDCDLPYSRETAAKALSHMDEVIVDVAQAVFLGAGCENLRVLEDVRGVGRVVIRGSTTGFERYADWLQGVMEAEKAHVAAYMDEEVGG